MSTYTGLGSHSCDKLAPKSCRYLNTQTSAPMPWRFGVTEQRTAPKGIKPLLITGQQEYSPNLLILFTDLCRRLSYSFIRSRQPSPIQTAWCLLLERQGEQASSIYHTCAKDARSTSVVLVVPFSLQYGKGGEGSIYIRQLTTTRYTSNAGLKTEERGLTLPTGSATMVVGTSISWSSLSPVYTTQQ